MRTLFRSGDLSDLSVFLIGEAVVLAILITIAIGAA